MISIRTSCVVYMSCYGTLEQTEWLSRNNAIAIVKYLKCHAIAYPLYMVNLK